MRQRKYELPRHTNLANQGPRIGAFFIDLALTLAITLAFFFGCFKLVFNFKTKPLAASIEEERISSHLFYKSENGSLAYFGKDSKNDDFVIELHSFYVEYIPSRDLESASTFSTAWFNENILKVEGDGKAYFEYDGGNKSLPAIIKVDLVDSKDVNTFLQTEWLRANKTLNSLPSFKKLNNQYTFFLSLEFVLASLIATTVTYIAIPILLKNGVTLGKKVFGLCLADGDGYVMNNHQLIMRVMPVDVLILALLIPIWSSMTLLIIVFSVILLVSFALAMASPKRCALHDFTAHTLVVNSRTSILFESVAEEEEYIAKEDNIVIERESRGEEPELKYEK